MGHLPRGKVRVQRQLMDDRLILGRTREQAFPHSSIPRRLPCFKLHASPEKWLACRQEVCIAQIHVAAAPGKPFISRGRTGNRHGCLVPAASPGVLAQFQVLTARLGCDGTDSVGPFPASQPASQPVAGC